MKIELESRLDIGQTVFYIAEDQEQERRQCEIICNECGAKHIHYTPIKYKVYEGKIENIVLEGSGEYHNVFIDKIHHLCYRLEDGWYANDQHLFTSKEEAEKYINEPKMRVN